VFRKIGLTVHEYILQYRLETGRCYFCNLKLVEWVDGSITCPDTWGPMPGKQIQEWTDEHRKRLKKWYKNA
jgi:hypothetical protein